MCSTAFDGDKPPRYWGGREAIARYALGRVVPADLPENWKARRSLFETVRKAIDGLITKQAIERIGGAFPGRSQEYAITVENLLINATPTQPEVGSFATGAWVNSNERLSMTQRHVGPETQHTQNPRHEPELTRRAPYVRPVERSEAA